MTSSANELFIVHRRSFIVWLVTVSRQGFQQPLGVGLMQHARAAQVARPLLRHSGVQVAGAGPAMLQLTLGGGAKTLLRTLMCLHLRHIGDPVASFPRWETSHFSRRSKAWEVEPVPPKKAHSAHFPARNRLPCRRVAILSPNHCFHH